MVPFTIESSVPVNTTPPGCMVVPVELDVRLRGVYVVLS